MAETSDIASDANEADEGLSYDSAKAATNVSIYLSLTSLSTIGSSYFGGYLLNFYSDVQIFRMSAILPGLTFIAGLVATEPSRNRNFETNDGEP